MPSSSKSCTIIARHCVEPYSIKIEETNTPTRIPGAFSYTTTFHRSGPCRYRCTLSPDPRYLALVSDGFAYGLRQGLKSAFNGHSTVFVATFEVKEVYRVEELMAKQKLEWLLSATTTLRLYDWFTSSTVWHPGMFRQTRVCEVEEDVKRSRGGTHRWVHTSF